MCDLRQSAVDTGKADALPANDGRRSGQADAQLWNLPDLWGRLFSRLYEQLGLLSAAITPRGEELLVRLAVWMPIAQACDLLSDMMGIQVSKATARRATLQTGEAALAVCEQQEQDLKREMPEAAVGADKQALSADGAFVPLVRGEWVEVKTLIIGEVTRNRRGLERAREVCAVQDGAAWLQGLVDYQRADAVRMLDFAHAAEYVNEIGQGVQAAGGRLPARWLAGVLHRLKHEGPLRVLSHLRWLVARFPSASMQEKLSYLRDPRGTHAIPHLPSSRLADWLG